ncbi:MAG: hypothetical protein IMZ63_01825 [Actinobacteria bacterium]|nr:hypothetical protein [Actinomycetota bacterium]
MQENNLIPCHLPLDKDTTVLVYIDPSKTYKDITGEALINLYADKNKRRPQPKRYTTPKLEFYQHPQMKLMVSGDNVIAYGDLEYINSLEWTPHTTVRLIHITLAAQLPEAIQLGYNHFSVKRVIQILEQIIKKKILSKEGIPLKCRINQTYCLSGIYEDTENKVLVILAPNKKAYILAPYLYQE